MHSFAIINGFRRNVKYFYKLVIAGKIVRFKSFENGGKSRLPTAGISGIMKGSEAAISEPKCRLLPLFMARLI
jgi:hypothetical protein